MAGKICTYRGKPQHYAFREVVVAHRLVEFGQRRDLPEVPACDACRQAKSELEHYLLSAPSRCAYQPQVHLCRRALAR